jgi:Taurine catabolism dioxygenase TauD, TfdA family
MMCCHLARAEFERLAAVGWLVISTDATTQASLAAEVTSIAAMLGEMVPGRTRQLVEVVKPETPETAHAASLSSRFGLLPFPLHTDGAHWTVPCRYLVLACLEPGPLQTPTLLLDTKLIQLSESQKLLCHSAVFGIRNGRQSFYGSILDSNNPFIRLDPGCMAPLSQDGVDALALFHTARFTAQAYHHDWRRGDIVVFDNWRVLHGRGYQSPTAQGRILMRTMVQ